MASRMERFAAPAALALAVLTLVAPPVRAAVFEPFDPDPRSRAMGGAFAGADGEAFAIFQNPAALMLTSGLALGVSYVQPYGVDFTKMTVAGVEAKLPGAWGGIGFGFRRWATDYSDQALDEENTFRIGQGFNLHKDVSSTVAVGYGLSLYTLNFGPSINDVDPGSAKAVGIDVAARVTLHNRTAVGFMAQNINNPSIGNADVEDLPRRLSGGVAYSPYAGVLTTFDMESMLGQKTRFRGGSEFAVTDFGALRVGIATDPNVYSAGLGVHWRGIEFNYGFSSGPGPLGDSHQVGVSLRPSLLQTTTGNGEE